MATQTFTYGPGSYIWQAGAVPGIISQVQIQAWGGGGGGGSTGIQASGFPSGAGGGGGGGYAEGVYTNMAAMPSRISVNVGVGGAGGAAVVNNLQGTATTFPNIHGFNGNDGTATTVFVGASVALKANPGTAGSNGASGNPGAGGTGVASATIWSPTSTTNQSGGAGGDGRESANGSPGTVPTTAGAGGGGGTTSSGTIYNGGASVGAGGLGNVNANATSGFQGGGGAGMYVNPVTPFAEGTYIAGSGGDGFAPGGGGGGGGSVYYDGSINISFTGSGTSGQGGMGAPGLVIFTVTYTPGTTPQPMDVTVLPLQFCVNHSRPIPVGINAKYKA